MSLDKWERWCELIMTVADVSRNPCPVHGQTISEWLELIQHDYDWIDREYYLDTIGG